jgi:porin
MMRDGRCAGRAAAWLFSVSLLVLGGITPAPGQDNVVSGGIEQNGLTLSAAEAQSFGGPSSVGTQVTTDSEPKQSAYRFEGLTRRLQPYYDFKARVDEQHGLAFGGDYQAQYQAASNSPGENHAAGGIVRLFGTWTLIGQESVDQGSLVFKVENRHTLGTRLAPQQLASEMGYAGLTSIIFSDAGSLLTNLYWQQSFKSNRFAFVAGIVDTTDYLNLYGLVNPWTDFSNLSFSTDPTIPAPNQGLGTAVRAMISDELYVLGGLADANGDPSRPGDSFNSFFGDSEYFKHLEFGWTSSFENRFNDNIHLLLWQVDGREEAAIPDGWGAAFSFSRMFKERWLPFARAAWSDGGGGAFLERSVSVGLGYFPETRSDVLGMGLNWGRPSEETFGRGLDDQYTAELYYRFQVFQHITVTPDIQYLKNPALNPDQSSIWVAGIRARLTF